MVNFEELLVPWLNVVRSFLFVFIIFGRRWVILVVCGPFNYLKEEGERKEKKGGREGRRAKEGSREGKRVRKGRMDCR